MHKDDIAAAMADIDADESEYVVDDIVHAHSDQPDAVQTGVEADTPAAQPPSSDSVDADTPASDTAAPASPSQIPAAIGWTLCPGKLIAKLVKLYDITPDSLPTIRGASCCASSR